ncbi:uncharacterized protein [Embiotoca jacksoni]|uniref:uncharacterized protein n=1 Tax=Embiotoca jacksoni TaxID=100190 RepID=UPI003703BDF8
MQCANLLRKRSLEPEVEPWSCRAKRICLEAELQAAECPMETSHSQQQQVGAVRPKLPLLCCPRCLGGEPGHINHIMGL